MRASRLPPDLAPTERETATRVASLEAPELPTDLRGRVLETAIEGGPGPRLASGRLTSGVWGSVGAAAAAILAVVGLFAFARAAGRVDQDRPSEPESHAMAVVDDPLMPIFSSLEPIGSLGPYDEVIADAGR